MDIDGVSAEILFPPQRTMSHFLGDVDEAFVLAGVDAYNNFLFDEFCAADPKRLIGMAQMPSIGIDSAVDGLWKAKARGAGARRSHLGRRGISSFQSNDDLFWVAAVDERPPVTIQINIIEPRATYGRAQAAAAGGQTSSTTCRRR